MAGYISAKDSHWSDLVSVGDSERVARDRSPACANVTNAELFDASICTRGKLQRDLGHVRNCVAIVIRQIHNWNKPCSAGIHLTVHSVDRDVGGGLSSCLCLV